MTLPDNLSPWENLQSAIVRIHNKIVREYFREDIPDNSINTSEAALKFICLMDDKDSAIVLLVRIIFFFFYTGYFFQEMGKYSYHWPKDNFHDSVKFLPQIQFYFCEPYHRRKQSNNNLPKRMEVTIRWSINPDNITTTLIANIRARIKSEFKNFDHYAGKNLYTYKDVSANIKISCYAANESGAEAFFIKIFEVLKTLPNFLGKNYDYNRKYIRAHKSIALTVSSETITVAGDIVKTETNQVTGFVVLKSAYLEIKNWFGDNLLYDAGEI